MDIKALNKINNLVEKYNAQLLPVIKDRKFEDIKKIYDLGFKEFGLKIVITISISSVLEFTAPKVTASRPKTRHASWQRNCKHSR